MSEPWGFGATALAAAVNEHLDESIESVFVGAGSAVEFARGAAFSRVVVASDDPAALGDILSVVSSADVLVSGMSIEATRVAAQTGVPCVFLDALAWMFREPFGGLKRFGRDQAPDSSSVAAYCVENFGNTRKVIESWATPFPVHVVGPIIATPPSGHDRPSNGPTVISLSALESRLIDDSARRLYLRLVGQILGGLAERTRVVPEFVLTGSALTLNTLEANASNLGSLRTLTRVEFLELLSRAHTLITPAGLRASFEGFAWGVPTLFLPPHNMSQELTLARFRDAGVNISTPPLRDLCGLPDVTSRPQPEAIALVHGALEGLLEQERKTQRLASMLADAYTGDLRGLGARQSVFLQSLGPSGAHACAQLVEELLV
jgi:hypothetical protein